MKLLIDRAIEQFRHCCLDQPRFRVAWLIGPPAHGKSVLARQLRDRLGWSYINYTLEPGYFDSLTETISRYQPTDLVAAIQDWCQRCSAPVLIVDEIDAVIATWDRTQRYTWAALVGRLQWLPCGVLIVSHLFESRSLVNYLPDHDQQYCFDIMERRHDS